MQILWSLPKSYSFLNKITSFQIEFRAENNDRKWIVADIVDGHVRAVTIKKLLPGNRLFIFFLRIETKYETVVRRKLSHYC